MLAQHFHQKYQDSSYQELLIEFDITNILALINSIDNQRLYETKWHKQWTLGRMIQFNTSSPMKNVRTNIRIFKNLIGQLKPLSKQVFANIKAPILSANYQSE